MTNLIINDLIWYFSKQGKHLYNQYDLYSVYLSELIIVFCRNLWFGSYSMKFISFVKL